MKDKIQEWRILFGVTSDENLARAFGVTASALNKWKAGLTKPSPMAQEKIDAALKRVSKGAK